MIELQIDLRVFTTRRLLLLVGIVLAGALAFAPQADAVRCSKKGTSRGDILRGTAKRDVFCGLGGSDRIIGRGGNDVLIGGPGHDNIQGGPGNDTLDGGRGDDRLDGGTGKDKLRGGAGDDVLIPGLGDDSANGGAGIDLGSFTLGGAVAGAAVTASLTTGTSSGQGEDTLGTIENLTGTAGSDRLEGDAVANSIRGGEGDDRISGLAGNDNLAGEAGNDHLEGGDGDDSLFGGLGDDFLDGGPGLDLLDAGDGNDDCGLIEGGDSLGGVCERRADAEAPKLESLSFDPSPVFACPLGPNEAVVVSARITDDVSGAGGSGSQISINASTNLVPSPVRSLPLTDAQRTSGTANDGTYASTVSVPPFNNDPNTLGSYSWAVGSLTVADKAGHSRTYSVSQLQSLALPTGFDVCPIIVN